MRANPFNQYTNSTQNPSRSRLIPWTAALAGLLTCSGAGLGSPGLDSVGRTGNLGVLTQAARVDTWDEIAAGLFELLLELLRRDPPPGYNRMTAPTLWATALDKAYVESGTPSDLSAEDTAAMLAGILQLDSHLRSDPSRLGSELQEITLASLRAIYEKLGGDPGDLGG